MANQTRPPEMKPHTPCNVDMIIIIPSRRNKFALSQTRQKIMSKRFVYNVFVWAQVYLDVSVDTYATA